MPEERGGKETKAQVQNAWRTEALGICSKTPVAGPAGSDGHAV